MAAGATRLLGPRKTIDETLASTELKTHKLRRNLGTFDVVVLGVGAMVGAGIFVLTGQAAATEAGPSITLSFALAGIVCALSALCYAELAAMVPAAGSAYTYTYATVGQLVAFIIGWDLVLEFTIGASAVAVGFAGYLNALRNQVFGVTLPDAITAPPGDGGSVNIFAIGIVLFVGLLLIRGIGMTAKATITFVAVTILVLLLVLAVGVTEVDSGNWDPYFPFGFSGVVGGAALVFFAYIGFDIVATTAEECKKPSRTLPIAILGSLGIVTLLYILVSGVLTGLAPFKDLGGDAPIADAFKDLGKDWIAAIVYVGALAATLKTVMLLMLGQSRVAFAMSRDRLIPERSRAHARALWHAAQDHADHDGRRCVHGGLRAALDARRAGEHRHAVRVHARRRRRAVPALGRPGARAPVPHAALPGGPDPGDPRLPLPRGDAAGRHLDPLRRVDGARARGLRGVRARLEPGGRGSGAREQLTQLGDRRPGALDDVAPRPIGYGAKYPDVREKVPFIRPGERR